MVVVVIGLFIFLFQVNQYWTSYDLILYVSYMFSVGKPLVHRMTLDVLANPSVVVPGGHPVTIVFCVSGVCQEWSNALPAETKKKIESENAVPLSFLEEHAMQSGLEKSNLNGFPFIPAGRKYFSPLTTGLLSQLATYQLMESASKLAI